MACPVNIKQINDKKHEDFLCVHNFELDIIIRNHYTCLQIPAYDTSLWDLMALKKIERSGFKAGFIATGYISLRTAAC